MKKIITTFLASATFLSASFTNDFSERARIQTYIDINNELNNTNLSINKENYLYNLNEYMEDRNITKTPFPILKEKISKLNDEFIYDENPFKYKMYLKKLSYKLPEKERLNLVKNIIMEEAENDIFLAVLKEAFKNECEDVENKRLEQEKLLEEKKILKYQVKKIPDCYYDTLTVNGKRNYFEEAEKKFIKKSLLREIYLSEGKSDEDLKHLLDFYKSKDYQDFHKFKKDYTLEMIFNKNKEEKTKEKPKHKFKELKIDSVKEFDGFDEEPIEKSIEKNNEIDFLKE